MNTLTTLDTNVALPLEILSQLDTREDYENLYTNLSQESNKFIWWQADLILAYYRKFVGQHLDIYRAGQLMSDSTVKYYLKTAAGFPPDQRILSITFNHHYQATSADKFDPKTLVFEGTKRFDYAAQAADEGMSARKLKLVIDIDKEKTEKDLTYFSCQFCGVTNEEVGTYIFYQLGIKSTPHRIYAHTLCLEHTLYDKN